MDILWVHWFGRDPDHKGGFETRRLHRIGLTDGEDATSYGFLNPGGRGAALQQARPDQAEEHC